MIGNISLTENSSAVNTFFFKEGRGKVHKISSNMDKHRFFKKIALLCCVIMVSSLGLRGQTVGDVFDENDINYEIVNVSPPRVQVIAFDTAEYIGNVVIPDTILHSGTKYAVIAISESAFSGNGSLTSVQIPVSVLNIGNYAFVGCENLTNIDVAAANTAFLSLNGVLYSKDTTRLIQYPIGKTNSNYVVHDSVKIIGKGAFAFDSALVSISLPQRLLEIDSNAFLECAVLENIVIPNNTTKIGLSAFSGCLVLERITIGSAVRYIDDYVFSECQALTDIDVDINNSYYASVNGVLFTADTTFLIYYPIGKTATSYTIPSQVIAVGNNAFLRCNNIVSIYFGGNSIETIQTNAFRGCDNLQNLGYAGFPTSLRSIGSNAFRDCNSLDTVIMGVAVNSIGEYAFYGCTALKTITVNVNNLRYASVNGILFTKNMDTLLLYPVGRTDTNYVVPSSVTRIENAAFAFCPYLKRLSIGTGVVSIGEEAFSENTNLTQIIANPVSVPQISITTFMSVPYDIQVYVACGSENNYSQDLLWNYFSNILPIQAYAFSANSNNTNYGTVSTTQLPSCNNNNTAIVYAYPVNGYGFDKWNDGNKDNPRTMAITANTAIIATFVNQYTVTATPSNIIMGTVSGAGNYNSGDTAILQANAYSGYSFTQWSDGNKQNPRQIKVSGNVNLTATFAVGATLTVVSNNTDWGTVSGGGGYGIGTNVQIQANPVSPHIFVEWNDGNTQNPRTITLSRDSIFTAIFNGVYTLTANVNALHGSVTGGANYTHGQSAILTASPQTGYRFLRWNDYNTQNPRTLTVTSDTSFTALFEKIYTITGSPNVVGIGSVTGSGIYVENTQAMLRAYPEIGYVFANWNDGNTENPRTITATKDSSFTAIFLQAYTVYIATNDPAMGNINITPSIVNNTLKHGDIVNLVAVPASVGHRFVRWSDDMNNTNPNRSITIVQDTNITAIFVAIHQLSVATADTMMGFATILSNGLTADTFDYGSQLAITATAKYGYRFLRWNDYNTQNPRTITLVSDTAFTATFVVSYVISLQVNDVAMGSVSGGGTFDGGSTAILRAVPTNGHRFVQWNDGDTNNPRQYIVTKHDTLTASFIEIYLVSAKALYDSCGSVEHLGNDSIYDKNATATLNAAPKYGYRFTRWTDGNTDNPRFITVTKDTVFRAEFAAIHHITVRSGDVTRGTVTGSGDYDQGDTATISATALNGYRFARWNDGDTNSPRNVIVEQSVLYTALFAKIQQLTVSVNNPAMGTALGNGQYDQDSTATIEAISNEGYRFLKWNDDNTDNPREVLITEDQSFTAIFTTLFKVDGTSNDTSMGIVVGSGFYDTDEVAVLTAVPKSGFRFVAWEDEEEQNPRSIVVTQNMSFKAMFAKKTTGGGDDPNPGIEDIQENNNIIIYPNPANGELRIKGLETKHGEVIEMFDILGKRISSFSNPYKGGKQSHESYSEEGEVVIDISHLPSGIYFIRIDKIVKKISINNE